MPLDLVNHHEMLLQIAAEGEDAADHLAGLVTGAQAGFFRFAYALIQIFPSPDVIRDRLGGAIRYGSGSVVGFGAEEDRLNESLSVIEDQLKDPTIPEAGRRWLEGLTRDFREETRRQERRPGGEEILGWE